VWPDTGEITIRTEADDQWLTLTVADTGSGIPPDLLKHLFEPGFVTTGTRVRVRSGLYTSYAIVQKHSGDIEVTSTVGQGTTFILKLPIYPTSSILPETPLTTAATAGGG
jgi:signal transduction histidine kinase